MPQAAEVSRAEAWRIGEKLGVEWDRVDFDEFLRGLGVELEHGRRYPDLDVTGDDLELTAKLALAHLREVPDYYSRLRKMTEEADAFWTLRPNQF